MSDAGEEQVVIRVEPPLAWCVINRPQAHNALNTVVWTRLADGVDALHRDPNVRVIIVRGAGARAFISGADISEFPALRSNAEMTAEYDQLSALAWRALHTAPQPVIGMINGLCFGGGVAVALACDIRIAADHARFAVPAVRLGLAYPLLAVERLAQIVGPAHAADVLLSGRTLDASEAMHIGLVNRVVPRAELEQHTRAYAEAMAEGAPLTVTAHKLAIREAMRSPADRDTEALHEAVRRCFDSADYQEGIAAFLAKRKPRFAGK